MQQKDPTSSKSIQLTIGVNLCDYMLAIHQV